MGHSLHSRFSWAFSPFCHPGPWPTQVSLMNPAASPSGKSQFSWTPGHHPSVTSISVLFSGREGETLLPAAGDFRFRLLLSLVAPEGSLRCKLFGEGTGSYSRIACTMAGRAPSSW